MMIKNMILAFIAIVTCAHAQVVSLVEVGNADVQNGKAYYSSGKIVIEGESGPILNPIGKKVTKKSKEMRSLTPSLNACQNGIAKVSVQLDDMSGVESMAFFTNTSVGTRTNVNIAVVRIKKEDNSNDTAAFKPIEVRIYDGEKLIAKTRIEDGIYPCALVVDKFVPNTDEQQIALSWISPGGSGYTAGVTVYALQ